MCLQILRYVLAHRGCYKSLRWNLTLEDKFLAATETQTHVSIAPGFSVGRSTKRAPVNWIMAMRWTKQSQNCFQLPHHILTSAASVSLKSNNQNGCVQASRRWSINTCHINYIQIDYEQMSCNVLAGMEHITKCKKVAEKKYGWEFIRV